MSNLFKHSLTISNRQDFINITSYIKDDIKQSKILNGIVILYCPHNVVNLSNL